MTTATVINKKQDKLEVIGTRVIHDTQSITPGNPAVNFNGNKLCNTFGYPLLIDEIRFETSVSSAALTLTDIAISPVALSARISAGQHKLHNTMTPILLFCKPNDRVITQPSLLNAGIGVTGTIEVGGVTWKLEKPLTLMPHETLDVAVQYPPLTPVLNATNPDPFATYTVTVTGVGRLVTRAPSRKWIPFVSAWVPAYNQDGQGTKPAISTSQAAQLFNPFNAPMLVKDVLGLGTFYDTAGNIAGVQNVNDTAFLGLATEGAFVQIVNAGAFADGKRASVNTGIRDYVPFYHAFLPQTRAWRMNAMLAPRSYLQARLKTQNWAAIINATEAGTDPSAYWTRFAIAIVGYSQEGQ